MLVVEILKHQKSTDIVDESVLLSWVKVDSILIFAIISNGVLQLQHFRDLIRAL